MSAVMVLTVFACGGVFVECLRRLRERRADQRATVAHFERVAAAPAITTPVLFDQDADWVNRKVEEVFAEIMREMPEAPRPIDAEPKWADDIDLRDDWTVN